MPTYLRKSIFGVVAGSAFLSVTGCQTERRDPCDSIAGACISVRAEGNVVRLDQITFTLGGERLETPALPRALTLPLDLAVIPPAGTRGAVVLRADAFSEGTVAAQDEKMVVLDGNGRGWVTMLFNRGVGVGPRDREDAALGDDAGAGNGVGGATGSGGGKGGSDGAAGSGGTLGLGGALGSGGATGGGGGSGTGGLVGAGGISVSGGSPGSGGATGSGGASGLGGIVGTGGRIGSGGATGSGGAIGTGGATGTGGIPGTGGFVGICTPAAKRCNGQVPQTCDAAGAWQDGPACVDQACVDGACLGGCAPGTHRCSSNTVVTCTASGQWGNPVGCAWPTPSCTNGACSNAMLGVGKIGAGGGTVTSSPLGISCGAACSASFATTPVVLTATPDGISNFSGWAGSGCSGTGTCTVDLTGGDAAVTATFAKQNAVLTVSKSGAATHGTVTATPAGVSCGSTCSASYAVNTVVELTAVADDLAYFLGWSGSGCSGTGPCRLTLTQDTGVAASFALRPDTVINRKPPPASNMSTVTVEFGSTQLGSTFECTLNGGSPAVCLSPSSFTLVANAANTISIVATDHNGMRDLSPAVVNVRQTPVGTPIVRYDFNNRTTNVSTVTSGLFNGAGSGFSYTSGKFNQGVKFNSADTSSLTFAGTNDALWASTSPDWTISLWWREDSPPKPQSFLFSIRGSRGWESYHGVTGFATKLTTCSSAGCVTFASPTPAVWHSLVYRYDAPSYLTGGPIQIYSDGVLAATVENSSGVDLLSNGADDLLLGSSNTPNWYADFYVDEIRIFDTVFTDAEQCTTVIGGTWAGSGCTLP